MTSDEDLNTTELDVSSKHIDLGTRVCSYNSVSDPDVYWSCSFQ